MKLIEESEIEEVLEVCAWVRRLVEVMQRAQKSLVDKMGEIEERCRIWEIRLRYMEGNENED